MTRARKAIICIVCKHQKIERGKTILPIERNDEILLITDIPARICANCGEAYLEEDTSMSVQKLANKKHSGEISFADSLNERKVSVIHFAI
ncbi:MAG: type II toxin-antitoxin system MqsA family antitoxin [Aridibacter sp.]